ncbi:MAG: hypothetical protein ABIS20_14820 [Thermoanaerobaculia bacterium]
MTRETTNAGKLGKLQKLRRWRPTAAICSTCKGAWRSSRPC